MRPLLSRNLNRWKRYGFPLEIYFSHSEFAHFLLSSLLGSQMKVTNDPICIIEGEPAILVEGEWTPFPKLQKRFSVHHDKRYRQKFLVENNSGEVFTYLGGGQGLTKHHPYKSHLALKEVSKEEYVRLCKLAKRFNGRDEEAVLQVVTTSGEGEHPFFSPRHIYLRLIDSDRKMHVVGFGYDDPVRIPLKAGKGLLRSPDFWEYKRAEKRAITNIPISNEGVKRFLHFVTHCLKSDSYAYHVLHHNCSNFAREAVFYSTGLKIPTQVRLKSFLRTFIPKFLHLPFKIFLHVFGAIGSAVIALISLLLGEGVGPKARKFGCLKKKERFCSPVTNVDYWLNFSSLGWHDPLATMDWQQTQASTEVVEK